MLLYVVAIVKFSDYLPPDFPFSDGPSDRRCCFKMDMRAPTIGFDELVFTRPKEENLLFAYTANDLLPAVSHARIHEPETVDGIALEMIGSDPWIVFRPFHTDEPYAIVELALEMGAADTIGLWEDVPAQCSRFRFSAGDGTLRLRVPSSFLDRPFRIDLGDRRTGKVRIRSLKVYADKAYAERLFELNPGLREARNRRNGVN